MNVWWKKLNPNFWVRLGTLSEFRYEMSVKFKMKSFQKAEKKKCSTMSFLTFHCNLVQCYIYMCM